jgi:hypothetical protein
MDWSWWPAELVIAVTGPHSSRFSTITWKDGLWTKSESKKVIFYVSRRMNIPDVLRKVQSTLDFKYM